MKTVYPDKMFTNFNDWSQHIHFENWRSRFQKIVKKETNEQIHKLATK